MSAAKADHGPEFAARSFTCVHCHVYARQQWWGYNVAINAKPLAEAEIESATIALARCQSCEKVTLRFERQQVYPPVCTAPAPHRDMPDDLRRDYEEAAAILHVSPRGSAALARLVIQKLCRALGERGDNINEDIGRLVAKGLPIQIQQALDTVRVIGNNAVHPGQVDVRDVEVAAHLFPLMNRIVEHMITAPREIEAAYERLPLGARDAVNRRDRTPGTGASG